MEMIVSIGLLALVSVALLGILLPAANIERDTKAKSESTYDISGELERALYSMRNGMDITNVQYITYEDHTIDFSLNGTDFSADGKMIRSKALQTDTSLYAFIPNAKTEAP